jgi:Lrp/AsnC family transcriptional regulator
LRSKRCGFVVFVSLCKAWLLILRTVLFGDAVSFSASQCRSVRHEWLRRFSEVIEFYRMSGDIDYLLRVVVPDIGAYDAFYKRLIAKIEIRDVSSSFAMEQIKYTTELPLDYMVLDKESGSNAA